MSDFSISEAQLVALFLEAAFWGMFVILFILCIQALLFKDSRLKPAFQIQWPLLVVACVMFAIGTLDIAVGLFHNIHAFVDTAASGKPDEQFQKISNWANVLKAGAS